MLKLLNFKWDKRTFYNICKLPFIVCIRTPIVVFFWGIEWINSWSDVIYDRLPGWNSH